MRLIVFADADTHFNYSSIEAIVVALQQPQYGFDGDERGVLKETKNFQVVFVFTLAETQIEIDVNVIPKNLPEWFFPLYKRTVFPILNYYWLYRLGTILLESTSGFTNQEINFK